MKRIFITATNTDIGKTYTTKLILKELASRGLRVGAIKPIETGVINGHCPDGQELLDCVRELNDEFKQITLRDIVPIQYELAAAPYVASNASTLDISLINKSVEKLERLCDVLVFEGAGGLFVPIDDTFMMIDLIKMYEANTLLVTHCVLGCINDTLLSKKALEDANIKHTVAFNCRGNDEVFAQLSEPYFNKIHFEVMKIEQNIDKICDVLYNS